MDDHTLEGFEAYLESERESFLREANQNHLTESYSSPEYRDLNT